MLKRITRVLQLKNNFLAFGYYEDGKYFNPFETFDKKNQSEIQKRLIYDAYMVEGSISDVTYGDVYINVNRVRDQWVSYDFLNCSPSDIVKSLDHAFPLPVKYKNKVIYTYDPSGFHDLIENLKRKVELYKTNIVSTPLAFTCSGYRDIQLVKPVYAGYNEFNVPEMVGICSVTGLKKIFVIDENFHLITI